MRLATEFSRAGEHVRIEGRLGVYRIKCQETNTKTGKTWLVVYGGDLAHPLGQNQWHHVRPEATRPAKAPVAAREAVAK